MTNPSPVSPELVRDAMNRSKRYWNEDGIPEIAIGGFWLLWGIIVLIPIAIPTLAKFRSFISIMGVLAAPAFMDFAVRRWKERATFPRGGYVQFRPPSGRMRLTLVITAAFLAIGVVLMVRFGGHHALPDWMGMGVGFLISLTLLQLAWRMRSVRLAILCWLVLAAGIAVTVAQVPHESQMIYVFLAAGVVCVTDGGLRLHEYKRQHPLPAEEQL
jgi:hypothetical protein